LWFAEKHNWDDRGWTGAEGAEKSSFDEIFSVFFPKGKKPLTFSEASEVLKSQKNKDESIDEQIDEETDGDTDEE
jgi:transcription initiation factor IIE alpha subunit